jgi:glycosyltransferase involved in cell wall biosynthesis
MVIAVNTRFLLKNNLEGCGYFIQEVFRILATQHPEHQFFFLFDRPFDDEFVFSKNVHPIVVNPPARHPVLWKYWYDVKIPAVLRKIKADVFVSPDGYCSLATKVPQCLVVHDLGFLHHPEAYKKSHTFFLKRYVPLYLKKARTVATVSEFSKTDILANYAVDPKKITVVYSAAREIFHPVEIDQQQLIKEKFTGGQEYFIYVGALQPRKNLINLLKAFSIFKKRQKSAMKLVLAGRMAWKNDELVELLKTYKYRNDVVLTGYVEENELVTLIASAYALVYPSVFEGFGVPVLEAMRCNVPALTSKNTSMQEIAGEAGLFFDPKDHHDIAEKLMLIYKDEGLRKNMIENGKKVSRNFVWEKTAGLLWECILATAK